MTFDFFNAYSQGFARVAAVTVPVAVANPEANATAIIEAAQAAHDDGVAVAVFPELSLTGYTSDDLHLAEPLLDATLAALDRVVEASRRLRPLLLVGAPLAGGNRVYNCAIAVHRGAILGVVPKSHLPAYREFYEPRWFAAAPHDGPQTIDIAGRSVPFGSNLIFSAADLPGLKVFAEVCEDMWVPIPPSSRAALAGATVLLNLSSSPSTVARAEDRRLLVRSASDRCLAAYVYAAAGQGESSTDLSWDGQTLVYECGKLLAETERFPEGARMSVADVDLGRIRAER
ncbi:MAG: NAD(+) synthase, partial [Promicromonosporaceae bacterium]|nr:NAD(+) synthase [Promicromonosporaceae bacterium]